MSSMDWRSLVSTDERLTSILRIVELAHAVQPFNEVLNRAKQAEASVFQRATSRVILPCLLISNFFFLFF
jgi:hypothetical protein